VRPPRAAASGPCERLASHAHAPYTIAARSESVRTLTTRRALALGAGGDVSGGEGSSISREEKPGEARAEERERCRSEDKRGRGLDRHARPRHACGSRFAAHPHVFLGPEHQRGGAHIAGGDKATYAPRRQDASRRREFDATHRSPAGAQTQSVRGGERVRLEPRLRPRPLLPASRSRAPAACGRAPCPGAPQPSSLPSLRWGGGTRPSRGGDWG
jgi:hypothetical protein